MRPKADAGSAAVVVAADKPLLPTPPAPRVRDTIARADFNRLAVRLNLPIYWVADTNNNKSIDPDEVATLLFYSTKSIELDPAYDQIVAAAKAPESTDKRRALVAKDLDQGRATLILNDLTKLDDADRAFAAIMLDVAKQIDELYAIQNGSAAVAGKVGADPESQSLYRRNFGAKCVGPLTEGDPACSAVADGTRTMVSVYPDKVAGKAQGEAGYCEAIEHLANAADLVSPFTVVREVAGKLSSVPYTEAYKAQLDAIASKLTDAAGKLSGKPDEAALVAYLTAAAASFSSNDWVPADEAWAKMSVDNSKWYVRVAPDEVYWEPCSHKAGFHLTFARINQASKDWQGKLTPVLQEMETLVAAKAGPPYAARSVKVHLPDFIDILTNSGDDRNALGGTIGQSLPNFGPVANEGRGRTVAMVNLYADPDSRGARRAQAEAVFSADSVKLYPRSPEPGLLSTILHEATHNLGPAHEYKVGGKDATLVFGGQIASMLEELKAQTGALYFVEFVRGKKLVTDEFALQVYADDLVWACGHVSQGMYKDGGKKRDAYNQLAAIQIGFLIDHGALSYDKAAKAANGKDVGALVIHPDKFVAAADELMKVVAGIKSRGDVKAADALIKKYVDSDAVVPHKLITERFLRYPKPSFVYAVKL